jgi:hypothetical protein
MGSLSRLGQKFMDMIGDEPKEEKKKQNPQSLTLRILKTRTIEYSHGEIFGESVRFQYYLDEDWFTHTDLIRYKTEEELLDDVYSVLNSIKEDRASIPSVKVIYTENIVKINTTSRQLSEDSARIKDSLEKRLNST